jgi:hypothetical protein
VRVDQNGPQALDAEPLDEPHAAHVGREVVNFHRSFADAVAIRLDADVEAKVLHAGHVQIPLIQRLLVHRADVGEPLLLEIQGQVAGNETAGTGDDNQVVLFQGSVLFHDSFLLLHDLQGVAGCDVTLRPVVNSHLLSTAETYHLHRLCGMAGNGGGLDMFDHESSPRQPRNLCSSAAPESSMVPPPPFTVSARMNTPAPSPLGLRKSFGFGDRLGLATPGHLAAVQGTGFAPVFAQQSIREMTRTRREPAEIVAAAWGALESANYVDPWGADADHLKTAEDAERTAKAGFTMFTIDPSAHVNNAADAMGEAELRDTIRVLAEEGTLEPGWEKSFLNATFDIPGAGPLSFTQETLWRAAVKYGRAIAYSAGLT